MRSSAVQMVCVALGALGLIGVIRCCTSPQWTSASFTGANIVTEQVIYEGLWMECVMQRTGQMQCKVYDSFLVLSSDLQASRSMTIISCVLCGLSLLILFLGADFTAYVQNEDTKPKLSLVAAVGLMLAGLLVIIPVSRVAHTLIRDFYNPTLMNPQKREPGACIYIGWAAGVILILTGVLLCCFSRPRPSSSNTTTTYYSNRASGPNDVVI
ncbi:claudin-4-like isoform X2 [Xiphophorus maculatus]|uniref:Claudin n=2 Tax=Xiphophorus maculatus TaxID=8083 RepID=A0A3B5QHM3_XIPMA|nr:claudin-4-like isoform X2 [Xiphophorus maculatus]